MFYQLNDAIFDHPTLVGREKIVLLAIARHINGADNLTAWPAIRTIAEAAGLKRSHVSRILKGLAFRGEIVVLEAGGPRRPAKYDLSRLMSHKRGHNSDEVCPTGGDKSQGGGGSAMSPKPEVMSPGQQVMSPLGGTESSNSHPSKNQETPSAFRAEASRLLKAMTADSRPAFADQDLLALASQGDAQAWSRFKSSTEGQTKRFMRSIA